MAVIYGFGDDGRVELTTIERLTPRDVVLANGVRFRRASIESYHGPALQHTPAHRRADGYRFLVPRNNTRAMWLLERQGGPRGADTVSDYLAEVARTVPSTGPTGPHWLVNRRIGKHIGAFTTRDDALFALAIAEDRDNWVAMDRNEFKTYLADS
ncbi:hypothetical protein [Nocardia sp. NPDC057030]|uniref:hypothetical protein n=1 Tax=unclassified Nocardia TaxID=2637762 RepID=UPI003634838E